MPDRGARRGHRGQDHQRARRHLSTVTLAFALSAALAAATLARVYRGGTTLNDHAVAAVVTGCQLIYPLLWFGGLSAGLAVGARLALGVVLAALSSSIYGLFHVLDGRKEPGALIAWAWLSQLAYSLSLWMGLLLLLRAPFVLWAGGGLAALCWPGWWGLLPIALSVWGVFWTYTRGGQLVLMDVPAPGLSGELRLCQLSDLHVGPTMRSAELARLVARVNALQPDLVVITGDLLMPFSERWHDFLLHALQQIQAPVLACPGNHDSPVLSSFKAELAQIGVPMLVDESVSLDLPAGRVQVTGVDFHWTGAREKLAAGLALNPPDASAAWRLLLAHDPRLFAWVPPERFDLVLSGHTHGGQVGADMFGLPWSVLRPLGVHDQGLWRRGQLLHYVHRGNWFTGLPPRMGIAGEILLCRVGPGLPMSHVAREDGAAAVLS